VACETSKISRNQIGFNRAAQKRCPNHLLFPNPVSYPHQLKYDSLGCWSSLICDTQAVGSNVTRRFLFFFGRSTQRKADCKLQETSKSGLARRKYNQGGGVLARFPPDLKVHKPMGLRIDRNVRAVTAELTSASACMEDHARLTPDRVTVDVSKSERIYRFNLV
jgi:hypothetical protein